MRSTVASTAFAIAAVRADEARSQGISQVVPLGVGFDARALRMPELASLGARTFEGDLAEQIETRRSILDAAGPGGRVVFDFGHFSGDTGTAPSRSTAWTNAGVATCQARPTRTPAVARMGVAVGP